MLLLVTCVAGANCTGRCAIPTAGTDDVVFAFSHALGKNNSLEALSLGACFLLSFIRVLQRSLVWQHAG